MNATDPQVTATPAQKTAAKNAAELRQILSFSRSGRRKRGVKASRADLERALAAEERKAAGL